MAKIIAPNDSNIYFAGRWGYKSHNGTNIMAALWVGGNFKVKFTGTSCTIKILAPTSGQIIDPTHNPQMEWSVDGGAFTRQNAIADVVITGLAAGTHTLEVWFVGAQHSLDRWSFDEGLMFAGLQIDDAAQTLSWVPWIRGRGLFIGDSITEGAWALTKVYGDSNTLPRNTDSRGSYPQQLAKLTDLEVYNCGLNGWGFSTKSGFPAPDVTMRYSCNSVLQTDPSMNVIFIALGHNHTYDYSMTDTQFETNYTNLINTLKEIHPEAKIFCFSLFTQLWANSVGLARNASIQKVAGMNSGCTFIDCSTMPSSYLPNGGHPDPTGAMNMAKWLLQQYLNPTIHAMNLRKRISNNARSLTSSRSLVKAR